jgi:hypothetical protein
MSSSGSNLPSRSSDSYEFEDDYSNSDHYEYFHRDLNSRVFIDIEVFMKTILRAHEDWKIRWGPTIGAVKTNQNFKTYYEAYCRKCEEGGIPEKQFYELFAKATSAVIDAIPGNPQPQRGAIAINGDSQPVDETNIRANTLHILRAKRNGGGISNGQDMSRMLNKGEDLADSLCRWPQLT